MQHDTDLGKPHVTANILKGLSDDATSLGRELVDIAGFLTDLDASGSEQMHRLQSLQEQTDDLRDSARRVGQTTRRVIEDMDAAQGGVKDSIAILSATSGSSRALAEWVQSVRSGSDAVDDMLVAVRNSNAQIASIASQVNILAMNAKIEAARAGQAGMGFAIVAEAINELSQKTSTAAADISTTIGRMTDWMNELRKGAVDTSEVASELLNRGEDTDAALSEIEMRMSAMKRETEEIGTHVGKTETTVERLSPAISEVARSISGVSTGVKEAKQRSDTLIDVSEGVMQKAVQLGSEGADGPMITLVQDLAGQISEAFEAALARGRISLARLFDTDYRPVPKTDPQQVTTAFTELTDAILPDIQEPVLARHSKVVFCAAVDRNGYLPTHNRKFSQPQSTDPVWNAANCRNRRIFDDRVGLKAGRNTEPFLLQIYRRDMGGGQFVMMKDLSAPIRVQGRHWGGLRLAYRM
ncbi:methyl-accepting chemotaxis protein [Roseivivax sediminis]|uniref:Methyl-accepting chemotaxis protein n=1 Tax=Roseivivax sediminis TaxID=936889 RepID=A0A1I1VKB5_9RHOB|nr:methyl-accepting chemotaxis protein [Roseivivax sediminis]SFD82478.1 methyl-accepting chemotaxis protein [Roseivivax sediminis]